MVALINFWDGHEILPHVIDNMKPLSDEVIIVYSNKSNYFNHKDNTSYLKRFDVQSVEWEPIIGVKPMDNERAKRNYALSIAKAHGHDYFLMLDADELYNPDEFRVEYARLRASGANGLVCGTRVYFGSPKLTIGRDRTLVPFIHRLYPNIHFVFNRHYPFAFDSKGIRIDPTRQLNYTCGIEWSNIVCEHYSWVRDDYKSKIENSSARVNIEKSDVLQELRQAKPGYFCKFYGRVLMPASVDFGIHDKNSQPTA